MGARARTDAPPPFWIGEFLIAADLAVLDAFLRYTDDAASKRQSEPVAINVTQMRWDCAVQNIGVDVGKQAFSA